MKAIRVMDWGIDKMRRNANFKILLYCILFMCALFEIYNMFSIYVGMQILPRGGHIGEIIYFAVGVPLIIGLICIGVLRRIK